MVSRESIQDFLAQKKLAVIGVSRDAEQFSHRAYDFLKTNGFKAYPVNPNAEKIENDKCYPNVKSLPEKVDRALILLPPEKTKEVLLEIADAGIKNIWLQQQTESPQAIQFCKDRGINVVYGQCIFMFAEPVAFFHRAHRWIKKATRTLPK
jgi:predicted CoA-binding protein